MWLLHHNANALEQREYKANARQENQDNNTVINARLFPFCTDFSIFKADGSTSGKGRRQRVYGVKMQFVIRQTKSTPAMAIRKVSFSSAVGSGSSF